MTDPQPPSKWKLITGAVAGAVVTGLLIFKYITEMTWAAMATAIITSVFASQ